MSPAAVGTKNGKDNRMVPKLCTPHQLQRSLHKICSWLIISWHSGIVRCKVSTGLMPRNMADGVPYEPDFILKLLYHLCVSGRMCRGGKCGCVSCQLVCTIFCAYRSVKDVWIPSIHTQYRAAILHYCNDHVLLVLNEFHSHKKTECWILKFNSMVTWECPQVPG